MQEKTDRKLTNRRRRYKHRHEHHVQNTESFKAGVSVYIYGPQVPVKYTHRLGAGSYLELWPQSMGPNVILYQKWRMSLLTRKGSPAPDFLSVEHDHHNRKLCSQNELKWFIQMQISWKTGRKPLNNTSASITGDAQWWAGQVPRQRHMEPNTAKWAKAEKPLEDY